MTRKHFRMFATAALGIADIEARRLHVQTLLPTLRKSNPRFDAGRFLTACGL